MIEMEDRVSRIQSDAQGDTVILEYLCSLSRSEKAAFMQFIVGS
jgi:hypothetical protein